MKKKILALAVAAMMLLLVACGSSNTAPAADPTPAPEATVEPAAEPTPEPAAPEAAADEWTAETKANYFFEETGEDIELTIKTNADHSKYNFTFLFFGDEQNMTCTADGEVLDDLTGFIGKDAEKFLAFIAENITDADWTAVGEAPASDWAAETKANYFFEETGEDIELTIKTDADHSKYNFTFLFFGDEQNMTCTADGEVLDDLTGFIGKDAEKFLAFIAENITDADWTAIG